ncbi:MAG: proline dehydrogenase family protein [Bacteroidales bacterium]|nr:proline dehydrogenase family protein [Bacteroidales bacterium]
MVNFENTEIAFGYKSNAELNWAYTLFSAIGNNALVKIGTGLAGFALKIQFPVGWAVKPTIYRQFVGGVSIEKCLATTKMLEKHNVKAILDYSVEGGNSEEAMESVFAETLHTIENAASNPNIPFAVFKPTAFAAEESMEKAAKGEKLKAEDQKQVDGFNRRVEMLCKKAHELNTPILIDAEHSYYQQFIDDFIRKMMVKYNKEKAIIFNTLQMYRHDRLEFLKDEYQKAVDGNYFYGAKFVRGAYLESERERAQQMGYQDPIQATKENTDNDYNAALTFCVEHLDHFSVFNGTHNEDSSNHLVELMEKHGIAKNDTRLYFSQLFGMSDHISFNLAKEGYNVAKYLPYGPVKHVLPYLMRRVEENTSVSGQTSRELTLLQTEKNRRKKS